MAKLLIFGIGDAGSLAHYYFANDSDHQVVAFTVDRRFLSDSNFQGLPIIDFAEAPNLYPPTEFKMFVAIGYRNMNKARMDTYLRAKNAGYDLVSYISTRCTFLSEAPTGNNCFILEDSIIQPYVRIGNNVTIWSGTHVGHHSVIEDHCFLAPRVTVCGRVRIGTSCFVGANATIRNSISLGPHTLIGAGAIIMKDTEAHSVHIPSRTLPAAKKSSEFDI